MSHLVIPGQVIAVSRPGDGGGGDSGEASSFLRGHGTYLERTCTENNGTVIEERLIASVTGTVQRVNKLISVATVSDTVYNGQVGDLVVGRITAVTSTRWKVQLTSGGQQSSYGLSAALPLSGVHLPGGVQRVRTAQDAREMRGYLQEGDLVSAEVHKVQQDGSLQLHTRSFRYGKLENGCLIYVPPGRIPRRKNHYTTILNGKFQVLLGCNGAIWMQRTNNNSDTATGSNNSAAAALTVGAPDLAELEEERRAQHATTPYTPAERLDLARLRNAVECLRLTYGQVTTESIEQVYQASLLQGSDGDGNGPRIIMRPSEMLHPNQVLLLTADCRDSSSR